MSYCKGLERGGSLSSKLLLGRSAHVGVFGRHAFFFFFFLITHRTLGRDHNFQNWAALGIIQLIPLLSGPDYSNLKHFGRLPQSVSWLIKLALL